MAAIKQNSVDTGRIALYRLLAVCITLSGLLIFALLGLRRSEVNQEETALVQTGVTYLRELNNGNVSVVSADIQSINKKKRREILEEDPSAVWGTFNNSVIVGDSRAVDFSGQEFLPESNVLAKVGAHIYEVSDYIDTLKAMQPEMIFLIYGTNDLDYYVWPEAADYAQTYAEYAGLLAEALPNTEIYVNSIPPAVGVEVSADGEDYTRISGYSEALQAMCEENGYHFVDNTEIANEHTDLYDADGVHFLPDFYIYWATNMIAEAY
ncbi:MAG: GDSL-type esterase/lipase family protein, partial [Clostridiales bacterium]|nr:GDSL-type esterase/lipase family protein [Clostridiales bacterium]